jgi:bis(5'-nucleosyl)-tetraphosphatase (symmetrical)
LSDEFWFVGDLVNRGPKSLEVLRLVRSLGPRAIVTLGNHDLHLLAYALTPGTGSPETALRPVLEAPDCAELMDWLRSCRLAHYRPDLNWLMVHAGVIPDWDAATTVALATEVEEKLHSNDCAAFLGSMYGNQPDKWSVALSGNDRLRFIVNCLTRIRYCSGDGRLDFKEHGPLGSQPAQLVPWFDMPNRLTAGTRVLFGHWSSLGLVKRPNLLGLDTGCVWGRNLTAARIGTVPEIFEVECAGG